MCDMVCAMCNAIHKCMATSDRAVVVFVKQKLCNKQFTQKKFKIHEFVHRPTAAAVAGGNGR